MLLMTGIFFATKNNLERTYIYKFIGIEMNAKTGGAFICLHNETLNVSANVNMHGLESERFEHAK